MGPNASNGTPVSVGSPAVTVLDNDKRKKADDVYREEIDQLKLDIRIRDADSRFLQEELDKKDRIMGELTEGLKEVALTHEQWAEDLMAAQEAYESQSKDCEALRERVAQLEGQLKEMDGLKARVHILEAVLKRKEEQIRDLTANGGQGELGEGTEDDVNCSFESIDKSDSFPVENTASWHDADADNL